MNLNCFRFFPSTMAAGHMEVAEKLPGGSDSILQSKDVLEKMPRKELQALAKEHGITANLKSAVIIEKILEKRPNAREHDIFQQFKKDCEVLVSEHMAAMNGLSFKAASAMFGLNPAVAPRGMQRGRQVEVLEYFIECFKEAQRITSKGFEAEVSQSVLAKAKLQSEVGEAAAPKPPAESNVTVDGVDVKATTAVTYAAIFVGDISKTVTNVQLQKVFNTNALVGRYYKKGIAKVLVPLDQLDQALSQDTSSISHGRKFRVAKWVAKAPSPRVHGHQAVRGRKILSAAYTASEDSLMKDRARFVAEFLTAAQNPGDGLQKSSPRGQRLYSQVHIASEKTTEMRIKSMEIAMRDMMRLLRCTK